jgi:hypothetical protein
MGCALITAFAYVYSVIHNYESKINDLQINLAHARISEPVKYINIHDTVKIASIPVSEIKQSSYKREFADKSLLKELNIKPNSVDEQQTTVMQYHDTIRLMREADVYRYHDKYVDFLLSLPDTTLQYSMRDSIVTIIHRIPKHHFLFWRWGTKGYEVKIRNFNPHAIIKHAQFIKTTK